MLIENGTVWLFRGLNIPLLFDNIGPLLVFFAPYSLQVFTWYSGKETCLESQTSMHESEHGYFFFLGMKAYFYLYYKSDKLFLYVTDKNICHNAILIVRPIDTVGYRVV